MQADVVCPSREVIYLDYNSTTPCDPRVVQSMLPFFTDNFGNPSSVLHVLGRRANKAVEDARESVAILIGARSNELVFTSGATESNNIVIHGLTRGRCGRKRVVTTPIEHKSVLGPLCQLSRDGYEVVTLPIDDSGLVDIEAAAAMVDTDTLLVSVQAANNEVGTLQPIAEMSALAHSRGALIHCDAAQAVGRVPVDVGSWEVDFLSISGHKLYGPKGIGALYMGPSVQLRSMTAISQGGGQENGIRPGTHNVPGIVGLGEACRICTCEINDDMRRVAALRDRFERQLVLAIPSLRINGNKRRRAPGSTSISFPGIDADSLILSTPGLALSMGSACNSGAVEPSYVLTAIGLSRDMARSTVRVALGRFTTESEVDRASAQIIEARERLIATMPT